jgi:hypothetical protein
MANNPFITCALTPPQTVPASSRAHVYLTIFNTATDKLKSAAWSVHVAAGGSMDPLVIAVDPSNTAISFDVPDPDVPVTYLVQCAAVITRDHTGDPAFPGGGHEDITTTLSTTVSVVQLHTALALVNTPGWPAGALQGLLGAGPQAAVAATGNRLIPVEVQAMTGQLVVLNAAGAVVGVTPIQSTIQGNIDAIRAIAAKA